MFLALTAAKYIWALLGKKLKFDFRYRKNWLLLNNSYFKMKGKVLKWKP